MWPQGSLAEAAPYSGWSSIPAAPTKLRCKAKSRAAVVMALESGVGVSAGSADYTDPRAAQSATMLKPDASVSTGAGSSMQESGGQKSSAGVSCSCALCCALYMHGLLALTSGTISATLPTWCTPHEVLPSFMRTRSRHKQRWARCGRYRPERIRFVASI